MTTRDTLIHTIETQTQLRDLARRLGVRADWHEPDEQGVSARVIGTRLDNAHGSDPEPPYTTTTDRAEINVLITQEDDEGVQRDIAVVNLATLLAFASGTYTG